MLSIIVAMDNNGLIGGDNHLPWHLPADLAYFKKTTLNKTVVMGRNTYEAIGRPLPKRRNIVVSRNIGLVIKDVEIVHTIQAVLTLDENTNHTDSDNEIFIIGGAQLYAQILTHCSRLYITQVDGVFKGDTHFPSVDNGQWQQTSCYTHKPDEKNQYGLTFKLLERL